jgi:hypothetical protein
MRDFESRLVGTTPDEFLARTDVEFVFGSDDFTLVDDEEDAAYDAMAEFEQGMTDRVKQWCFANGQTPHPLLSEVVAAFNEALVQSLPPDLDPDEEVESISHDEDEIMERTASFVAASFENDTVGFEVALAQFEGFLQSMKSPEELLESLGLGE